MWVFPQAQYRMSFENEIEIVVVVVIIIIIIIIIMVPVAPIIKVIPVIISATGTISKSFRKYVSNIPGNHKVKELQKTAILGTAHILREVLT
jgi:hypothetical protein